MTHQHPVDRGPGHVRMPALAELEDQAARPPPAMRATQVADNRFHLGADPPWMCLRRMRPVSQAVNTAIAVTRHPAMNGLASHSETLRDLGYRDAVQDLQHGLVSLLDHVQ